IANFCNIFVLWNDVDSRSGGSSSSSGHGHIVCIDELATYCVDMIGGTYEEAGLRVLNGGQEQLSR
ncbi:hypothetical protein P7K49_014135, partial [Saguinus oedipus]